MFPSGWAPLQPKTRRALNISPAVSPSISRTTSDNSAAPGRAGLLPADGRVSPPAGAVREGRTWWIGRPRGIRGSAPRASVASPGSGGRYHGLAARSRRTPQRPWPHGARDKVSGARAVPGGPGAGPPGTVAARLPPTRSVPLCEYDADVSFSRPGERLYTGRQVLAEYDVRVSFRYDSRVSFGSAWMRN